MALSVISLADINQTWNQIVISPLKKALGKKSPWEQRFLIYLNLSKIGYGIIQKKIMIISTPYGGI